MTHLLLVGFFNLVGCTGKSPPSDDVSDDTGTYFEPGCGDCDGYSPEEGDCNDMDPSINPSAEEVCGDEQDNDCDGEVDEGGETSNYRDADEDGFGDTDNTTIACIAPDGYLSAPGDCDDTNEDINPAASEICDGVDNDCDSEIDEHLTTTWYADTDGDGYGDAASTLLECDAVTGYVAVADDCDDTRADVNPAAAELCDGVDNDCDSEIDEEC